MNPARTDQRPSVHETAGSVVLWTGKWSIGRRVAVFVVGLLQQFFHAGFFRMVLVPGYEWLVPIDPLIYLLTEAAALATSFGLLALPFVKAPGRTLRAVLMASFAFGVLANAYRMLSGVYMGDFWFPFTCDPQEFGMPCGDTLDGLITDLEIHFMFGAALSLNLFFLLKLRRADRRGATD
jgi:hypothetical protein